MREKQRWTLLMRAAEARSQQLRGIFAAFDENRDGLLSQAELSSALLALGVQPSAAALQSFYEAFQGPNPFKVMDFATVSASCRPGLASGPPLSSKRSPVSPPSIPPLSPLPRPPPLPPPVPKSVLGL